MPASGSYILHTLENPGAERERLERQAGALWQDELAFLRKAGLQPGARVLDLGCGNGRVAARLAEAEPGAIVVGVDRDASILPKDPAPNLVFQCAEAGRLQDALGTFDLIYARFLLQHVPDPGYVLRDATRHLVSGGRLVVVDSDDALLLVDPPDPELDTLLARARQAQHLSGGDRCVGRKLPRLFMDAGLQMLAVEYRHLDSVNRSFSECYALATGFKAALLGEGAAFAQVGARLSEEAAAGKRFLSVGICAAVGRAGAGEREVRHDGI